MTNVASATLRRRGYRRLTEHNETYQDYLYVYTATQYVTPCISCIIRLPDTIVVSAAVCRKCRGRFSDKLLDRTGVSSGKKPGMGSKKQPVIQRPYCLRRADDDKRLTLGEIMPGLF